LVQIVKRSANLLGVQIDNPSASELAKRARGTPRIVNNLLRWVRDFSQMRFQGQLNHEIMKKALETLEIDELGLDAMDQKILFLLIHHYEGGPVGLNTLATALGENPQTLEEVYEPYLILQGLIKRTPRGREITALGLEHLNRSRRENSVGV
jgi:Holliday junction DNA helicase RuvB